MGHINYGVQHLIELNDDKITPKFGTEAIIVESATYPVVFSNGERTISNLENIDESLSFECFPNPVNGLLTLNLGQANHAESVRIYDAKGVLIQQLNVEAQQIQISTESWVDGIYFVQLNQGDKYYVKKIVK